MLLRLPPYKNKVIKSFWPEGVHELLRGTGQYQNQMRTLGAASQGVQREVAKPSPNHTRDILGIPLWAFLFLTFHLIT